MRSPRSSRCGSTATANGITCGDTKKKLEVVGKAKGTGTTVSFKPDTEIFTETRFDYATIANRLRELAFLNKALTIVLKDERKGSTKEETFYYKGGLSEFVKWIVGNRRALHPKAITFEATREDVEVEGAVQYDDQYSENTFTFVNNIRTAPSRRKSLRSRATTSAKD